MDNIKQKLVSILFLPFLLLSVPQTLINKPVIVPNSPIIALVGRSAINTPQTKEDPLELILAQLYGESEPREDETDVIYLVNYYSRKYGVDFELAFDLADWESEFDRMAKNGAGSSAMGIYQFLTKDFPGDPSTWTGICVNEYGLKDVFNAKDNIECAMKLIGSGGLSHWSADKNIKKLLKENGYL